jgi:hypothetical protein
MREFITSTIVAVLVIHRRERRTTTISIFVRRKHVTIM